MLAKRIIPCLDIKDGRTVKGVNFVDLRDAGDPVELAAIYSKEGADELVFLDISATERNKSLGGFGVSGGGKSKHSLYRGWWNFFGGRCRYFASKWGG